MIKIFAHRGLVNQKAKENSLESLHAAYEKKFIGIEFDIWFVDGQLLVCHDKPQGKNLPKFSEFLFYGNKFEYWLDFKNLDETNTNQALELIKQDLKSAKIDMKKIYFAPFITDLEKSENIFKIIDKIFADAQIMAVCEEIAKNDLINYHNFLLKNKIKFLSIYYKNIDKKFMEIFKNINIFAWTINDPSKLRRLYQLGVKNFASDIVLKL